jgi:hypothetical protein
VSTFLVSLGVVAATIAAVVYVVLNGPDQPATIRRQPSRAKDRPKDRPKERSKRRPGGRTPRPVPVAAAAAPPPPLMSALLATGPGRALPDSDVMRLRVLPAGRTTLWVRIRSGVALMVLVAVLGALLALAIGAVGLGLALLIRSATG